MIEFLSGFKKANSIHELVDKIFLGELFGPIRKVERHPLKTSGFSGSAHEKVILQLENGKIISLFLKLISSSLDMTVWRSGNIANREALLLGNTNMFDVWKIFKSPYVAYATEGEHSGLLMYDVSRFLFPDIRKPIDIEDENFILHELATMHAHYWESDLLSQQWLAKQDFFFSFLGPHAATEEKLKGHDHPILISVQNGWDLAFALLPSDLSLFLLDPPIKKLTADLPKTLIHGDSKLANFAILPGEKLTAFDWTLVAAASPGCEIGWYISVNASRLAGSKEQVLNRYREFLQTELNKGINSADWKKMVDVAVLTGAETLLWNKALNLQKNIPGSKREWEWWVNNIRICKEKYA